MPSTLAEDEQEKLSQWVSEWKEEFSTRYAPHDLEGLLGKKVNLIRPGSEEIYTFTVVGYSKQVVHDSASGETAVAFSIITLDGRQIQLRTGVVIELAQD